MVRREEPARNIVRPGDYIVSFNGEKIYYKKRTDR